MDQSKKKRKVEENGDGGDQHHRQNLTPEDVRKVIEHFTPDQLIAILAGAASRNPDVLAAVRSVADSDPSRRKLFVRGLGWETTADGLRSAFLAFGEIDEAVVILDKATGKSKGYGFVTFRHVDSAVMALRDPSKRIEGRVAVAQLASAGNTSSSAANGGSSVPPSRSDDSARKIYVGNVPYEMSPEKLLAHFSLYGEIEDGPLGFDKQTGKCRGFALFVYKRAEGARAALVDPVKTIDGRQLNCKLAVEGKKGKTGGGGDGAPVPAGGGGRVDGAMGVGPGQGPGAVPMGAIPGHQNQYGPGRMGAYGGGFPGNPVYHGGEMGPEGYAGGYNGGGGGASNGGLGGGTGGLYRMPAQSGGGMPGSGGYPPFPAMSVFPGQHHQQLGAAGSVGKVPPGGGMYPPPYY